LPVNQDHEHARIFNNDFETIKCGKGQAIHSLCRFAWPEPKLIDGIRPNWEEMNLSLASQTRLFHR
jgi:hypothetical protein